MAQAVWSANAYPLHLPTYSPELTPIELLYAVQIPSAADKPYARAAGLGGTWRAGLTTPGTPSGSRISGGPWSTVAGVPVFDTAEQIIAGPHQDVAFDEYGEQNGELVWTGAVAGGAS